MLTNGKKVRLGAIASILILSTLLATFLSISLVSAHGTPKPRTWQAVVGAETKNHAIQGFKFLPGTLYINVGDTVVWTTKEAEIQTVTFLAAGTTLPPFTGDPSQTTPQAPIGSNGVYDGVSYYNSGLLSNFPPLPPWGDSFTLTFNKVGDLTYYSLTTGMIGVLHVRPAGAIYPFSQQDYNRQIDKGTRTLLNDGQRLVNKAKKQSSNLNVTLGIGDSLVAVLRFFPQRIVIHVGDTVKFTNHDPIEPHTVSFGTISDPFTPVGNPGAFDGSTALNSGDVAFSTTYKVKFIKAGTYPFFCDFHDFLGMVATIVVKS
jgi:plastocyanin